ncbi:phage portal protein [bacterium]|nr:phage portal protein [bacterium]NDC95355.1 phage portal protein [bacterium]NDD85068.1 phage portal protein [bacterium]NDG19171.1 phage portal protein [Betaproteobacteria bacterium]
MSVLFRTRTPGERRDYGGPWQNGITVPGPLQDSSTPYGYSSADALRIAAVVACVSLRAGAFAQLPIKAFRSVRGVQELLPTQPQLLTAPSPTVPPSVWKTQMSISRDIWGYAAGRILGLDAAGYPAQVEWMSPADLQARQQYVGGPFAWRWNGQEIDESLVLHIPSRFVLPGKPLGMSPLEQSGLVDLAKRAQDFGRDWFRNGAMPSAVIYSDEKLTAEQADGIVSTILGKWRQRRPAVLGSGLKYEAQSVKANESQFIESMTKTAADIAISFNLPPNRIAAAVSGQSITYANLEQSTAQYLMDSINPDLVIVQEVLERQTPRTQILRWQTGAFLRSDLATRYSSYATGISAGFLTPDEARAWEDLPPLPASLGGAE